MKNLFLISTLLILATTTSCSSPEARNAADKVTETHQRINADGVVTPEEEQEYREAVLAYFNIAQEDMNKFDWEQFLYTIGGSVSTAFFGINWFRNRREEVKWGPPPNVPASR